jgi:hypothetical protein
MIAHPADVGDLRHPAPPEAADPPHLPLAPASAWELDDSRARPSHRGPGCPGDAGPAPRDSRRRSTLVQCGWAAGRKRASSLQAQHHHLRGRRGAKKAICAVAASLLTAACRMLKGGTACRELGPEHFDRRAKESQAWRHLRRLADLGHAVAITPPAPGPA